MDIDTGALIGVGVVMVGLLGLMLHGCVTDDALRTVKPSAQVEAEYAATLAATRAWQESRGGDAAEPMVWGVTGRKARWAAAARRAAARVGWARRRTATPAVLPAPAPAVVSLADAITLVGFDPRAATQEVFAPLFQRMQVGPQVGVITAGQPAPDDGETQDLRARGYATPPDDNDFANHVRTVSEALRAHAATRTAAARQVSR